MYAGIRGLLLWLPSITKHAEKGLIESSAPAVVLAVCKAVLLHTWYAKAGSSSTATLLLCCAQWHREGSGCHEMS